MAKIIVRREQIAERRRLAGIESDFQLAQLTGLHPTQLSRVLTGKSIPGNKFIAGVLQAFGIGAFQDLFAVVDDNDRNVA